MRLIKSLLSDFFSPRSYPVPVRRDALVPEDAAVVRVVTHGEDGASQYYMPVRDIGTFWLATVRLHMYPGINPRNGLRTKRVESMEMFPTALKMADCNISGRFWWSTPDLGKDGDPKGALILEPRMTVASGASYRSLVNIPKDKKYPANAVQCDDCGGLGCETCDDKGWLHFNHPKGRTCHQVDCDRPIPPSQVAMYCSDECALLDAHVR